MTIRKQHNYNFKNKTEAKAFLQSFEDMDERTEIILDLIIKGYTSYEIFEIFKKYFLLKRISKVAIDNYDHIIVMKKRAMSLYLATEYHKNSKTPMKYNTQD